MVDSTEHSRFENIETLPLIRFEHVWVERNGKILLKEINWDIHSNENWVVIGKNGTGKSLLTTILQGKLPCSRGEVIYSDESIRTRIAQVSFEVQTRLIAYEQDHEWIREFGTNQEKGTTVYRLLDIDPEDKSDLIRQTEIMKLMNIMHLIRLIDSIARTKGTQVLFVTHRRDELPSCITHVLEFKKCDTDSELTDRFIAFTGRIEDSVKNI
jgi:ABC-type molybdenum transport system ATPase subunit/photorepair protein PhrA